MQLGQQLPQALHKGRLLGRGGVPQPGAGLFPRGIPGDVYKSQGLDPAVDFSTELAAAQQAASWGVPTPPVLAHGCLQDLSLIHISHRGAAAGLHGL